MWRRPKRWRSAAAVWLHTPHTSHICVALCSLGLSVSLMTVMSMSNQLQETHYLRSLEQWSCSLQIVAPRCAITTKTKSHAIRMSSFCFSFIAHVGTANFFSRISSYFQKKIHHQRCRHSLSDADAERAYDSIIRPTPVRNEHTRDKIHSPWYKRMCIFLLLSFLSICV